MLVIWLIGVVIFLVSGLLDKSLKIESDNDDVIQAYMAFTLLWPLALIAILVFIIVDVYGTKKEQ